MSDVDVLGENVSATLFFGAETTRVWHGVLGQANVRVPPDL
jgi:hypothetical protein